MPIRGVLFDLDGTLLNTLDDLAAAVNAALAAHHMPSRTVAEVCAFVGDGIAKLIERAVPPDTSADKTTAVLATFRALYVAHSLQKTAPYDGIQPLLAHLRDAGLQLAIVTNKIDSATQKLRQHFFADTIALALGDSPDRPRKPAPDSALLALQQLELSPDEAVFVGDSDVDIATAANAAIPCIAVSWGFRSADFLKSHGATVIANSPQELEKIILKGSL